MRCLSEYYDIHWINIAKNYVVIVSPTPRKKIRFVFVQVQPPLNKQPLQRMLTLINSCAFSICIANVTAFTTIENARRQMNWTNVISRCFIYGIYNLFLYIVISHRPWGVFTLFSNIIRTIGGLLEVQTVYSFKTITKFTLQI